MTEREQLSATVQALRDDAIWRVRLCAQRSCPDVPASFVRAIENALGDISVDEALDALAKYQAEHEVLHGE